jgi:hypothetical protein
MQPITAVNVFVLLEVIIIAVWAIIPYGIDSKEELKKPETTRFIAFLSASCLFLMWVVYGVTSAMVSSPPEHSPRYPDVLMILIILMAIDVFIVCPVSVAIARCKE